MKMKVTDKEFVPDMAEVFKAGLMSALESDSEVFAFSYAGGALPTNTPGLVNVTAIGCHPEMKCVVLMWPAALADLLVEGIPVVRAQIETIADQVAAGTFGKSPCGVACITTPAPMTPILCDLLSGHSGDHKKSFRTKSGELDGFRTWPNPQVDPIPLQ